MKSRHLPSEDGGLSDHQVLGHLAVVVSKMWIACCDPQKKCALWNPYALPSREVAFTGGSIRYVLVRMLLEVESYRRYRCTRYTLGAHDGY